MYRERGLSSPAQACAWCKKDAMSIIVRRSSRALEARRLPLNSIQMLNKHTGLVLSITVTCPSHSTASHSSTHATQRLARCLSATAARFCDERGVLRSREEEEGGGKVGL